MQVRASELPKHARKTINIIIISLSLEQNLAKRLTVPLYFFAYLNQQSIHHLGSASRLHFLPLASKWSERAS